MDFTPTYERRVTAEDEGSDWLYVDPTDRSRHRVEIDVVPDRAQKIRIQHLDRDMRGRSEWVPIGRAKVPWELRDAYAATEEMWRAAEGHRPPTAHSEVATQLFGMYVGPTVADMFYNGSVGILEVSDTGALAKRVGIAPEALTEHPDSFVDEALYVPWPTTLRVLRSLCESDPQPALEMLAQRRASAQKYAQQVARYGDPEWVQEARNGNRYAKRIRRWHETEEESIRFLNELVDAGHNNLAEDFLLLREMYLDLVRVAPAVISRVRMVRAQLSNDLADELQRLVDRPLPRSAELLGADHRMSEWADDT